MYVDCIDRSDVSKDDDTDARADDVTSCDINKRQTEDAVTSLADMQLDRLVTKQFYSI